MLADCRRTRQPSGSPPTSAGSFGLVYGYRLYGLLRSACSCERYTGTWPTSWFSTPDASAAFPGPPSRGCRLQCRPLRTLAASRLCGSTVSRWGTENSLPSWRGGRPRSAWVGCPTSGPLAVGCLRLSTPAGRHLAPVPWTQVEHPWISAPGRELVSETWPPLWMSRDT